MADPKPTCAYGPSCYRLNPIHFQEIAHPHLDKLLDSNYEDMPIQLPDTIDFACYNKSLLIQQLEILRNVKRKKSIKREVLIATIDLTDDDDNLDISHLKDEENCIIENAISNYENTISNCDNKIVNYDNTVANYEHTQSQVDQGIQSTPSEREEILEIMRERGEAPAYVPKSGKFVAKLSLAAPYYIFFTTVQNMPLTWRQKLSITMSELLDKSLGKITRSLHINFIVDLCWLLCQYKLAEQTTDMLIFFSIRDDNLQQPLPANIKMQKVTTSSIYSVHHSKVSIFQYEDGGIRIIVSSANLYRDDWELRTQGLWISPHLPLLPNSMSSLPTYGESRTGFKRDFLEYLSIYNSEMHEWRIIVQKCDFSAVNVAFVSSVPGDYRIKTRNGVGIGNAELWGHRKLGNILKNHVEIPKGEPQSMIIAQASSIGSLGPTYDSWIGGELVNSMSKTSSHDYSHADFHFIFPTNTNYKESYDMLNKSTCLFYTKAKHMEQRWITPYLRKWKASCSGRTKALPHIKSFTRISSDGSKMWWFVLGSANLSKAAWGWRQGYDYRVNNYEAGVVFLPKFVTGEKSFPIVSEPGNATPNFPIPYDLPLTRYIRSEFPYFTEFFDICHGRRV